MMRRNRIPPIQTMVLLFAALALTFAAVPRIRAQVADEQSTFRLAQVYEQGGKLEQALRYYKDLYTARPTNSGYFDGVRRCLTALKRYDEAIDLIGSRMALYPKDASLYVERGAVWFLKGDHTRAEQDWDAAVSAMPNIASVYTMIADEAVNVKQYELAVRYLEKGRENIRNPQLFVIEIARAWAMAMRYDKAMEEYIRYVVEQPAVVWQVQQQIAWFSDIPQAMETALKLTREAASDNGSSVSVRYLLAWLYMEYKDYQSAAKVYAEIDKLRGAKGVELFSFAQRAFHDNAWSAARTAFADVIARFPDAPFIPEAEFLQARSMEELSAGGGDTPSDLTPDSAPGGAGGGVTVEDVIARYGEVAAKYPEQAYGIESRFRIARIRLERLNDPDGALSILSVLAPVRRSVMGRVDGYILAGDALASKGDLPGALAQYSAVLGMQTSPPDEKESLQFKIAELHYFDGRFDTALAELEPLTANCGDDIANDALSLSLFIQQFRSPDESALRSYARAMYLQRRRKYGEAAALMRDIMDHSPTAPIADQATLMLAVLQRKNGQPADAAGTCDAFLAASPDAVIRDQVLFTLAQIQEEDLGNAAKAVDLYQQLLAKYPNSLYADRARARILALRKGQS